MKRKFPTLLLSLYILGGLILSDLAWGEDHPRFVTHGDTVYDKQSHLTWTRCSVGQNWKDGAGCEGTAKTFTFDDAQKLKSGGWRIPNTAELATLFGHARSDGKQNISTVEEEFPDNNLGKLSYWTRTPSSVGPGWGVAFAGGQSSHVKQLIPNAVRLVRGKLKS